MSETREDTKDVRFVSREMGESIAERIGAVSYVECSAKTGENIEIVFYQAARASLAIPKSNSRGSNPSGSFSSLPLSIRPNTDALNSLSTTKGRRQKLGSNSTHGNMNKCTLF